MANGDNVCTPYYEPGTRITGKPTADVTGKRFVKISADIESGPALSTSTGGGNIKVAPCGAGQRAVGVAAYDASLTSGETVPLINGPGTVVPITAGAGGVTAGDEISSDATGKAVTATAAENANPAIAATFGTKVLGLAFNTAIAGADVMVRLYT